MFEEIGEKPSFKAVPVGTVSEDQTRPVKVSLRNCETVRQLLFNLKAKELKTTTAYRKVYISPDRSPEERIKHRQLVDEMRRKRTKCPDMHYYIHGGHIVARDKG